MTPNEIGARVLAEVEAGRLSRGGPSHLAALDLLDEIPSSHWQRWNADTADRIRAKAEHPRCVCGTFYEAGRDGRCERCFGTVLP